MCKAGENGVTHAERRLEGILEATGKCLDELEELVLNKSHWWSCTHTKLQQQLVEATDDIFISSCYPPLIY